MVHTIGADSVIDYTQEDFTQGEQRYDLILDNVANHSFSDLRRVLTPQGLIVPNSGHSGISYIIKATFLSLFMKQQGSAYLATAKTKDLLVLKEMIESGKITPVIDRTFPLSQTPDAFRYLEEEHARGKVVITVKNQAGS
jgi:NADPH:quinone reductase-like Zn-dependent oxidoreductase